MTDCQRPPHHLRTTATFLNTQAELRVDTPFAARLVSCFQRWFVVALCNGLCHEPLDSQAGPRAHHQHPHVMLEEPHERVALKFRAVVLFMRCRPQEKAQVPPGTGACVQIHLRAAVC